MTMRALVAGHICLDLTPIIPLDHNALDHSVCLTPGSVVSLAGLGVSPGGAVANTGTALSRLGIPTSLCGKIGEDLIGKALLDRLRGEGLSDSMIVAPQERTSFSIVISPPGIDRIFFHDSGANDTFCAQDIPLEQIDSCDLFHFGYPPVMRRMWENDGRELETIMRQAGELGATTSIDFALPDPASPAGRADWLTILKRVLPWVDIAAPSIDEARYMLKPILGKESEGPLSDLSVVSKVAELFLQMGAKVAMIKCGTLGIYLRTRPGWDLERAGPLFESNPGDWDQVKVWQPCYVAQKVVNTTGAGDCAIAGFLAALMRGRLPADCLKAAAGAGAQNVCTADATSGISTLEELEQEIADGWPTKTSADQEQMQNDHQTPILSAIV